MQDAWRAYLELALGLTEASRKKATQVVKSLAEQSGGKVEDLQSTVEGLVSSSAANRDSMVKLVRYELDRALGKVGLATGEEVAELNARVQQLEIELREAKERAEAAQESAQQAQAGSDVSPKAQSTKKATKKKATTTRSKKATTGKKQATKKTAAKKSAATKKTTPKKAVAKKSTAKKSAPSGDKK